MRHNNKDANCFKLITPQPQIALRKAMCGFFCVFLKYYTAGGSKSITDKISNFKK